MKTCFFLNFILFLLFGCVQSNNSDLSEISKIKVKSLVLDKKTSNGLVKCDDDEFNMLNSCYYKIDGDQYVKQHSYVFNNDGSVSDFYHYLPEGPLIYNFQDLQKDTLFAQYINYFNQKVNIYSKYIIDNGDTVSTFKIFRNPNVILADISNFKKNPLSKGRIIIYEY